MTSASIPPDPHWDDSVADRQMHRPMGPVQQRRLMAALDDLRIDQLRQIEKGFKNAEQGDHQKSLDGFAGHVRLRGPIQPIISQTGRVAHLALYLKVEPLRSPPEAVTS